MLVPMRGGGVTMWSPGTCFQQPPLCVPCSLVPTVRQKIRPDPKSAALSMFPRRATTLKIESALRFPYGHCNCRLNMQWHFAKPEDCSMSHVRCKAPSAISGGGTIVGVRLHQVCTEYIHATRQLCAPGMYVHTYVPPDQACIRG